MKSDEKRGRSYAGLISTVVGIGVALAAFVAYLVTLSVGAYPGESAGLVVEYTGLFPRVLPTHPLWAALVALVSRLPGGTVVGRLNLLSAICGAGAIWLLYDLVRTAVNSLIMPDVSHQKRQAFAGTLAGLTAAVFFAFCIPFWMVSNRAHHAPFDLLLLLAIFRWFVSWLKRPTIIPAVGLIFAIAVLSTELATAMLFAPLIGLTMLFRLWKTGGLNIPVAVALALAGVVGLSVHLVSAWIFCGSEGFVLREYNGYWHVVRQILQSQYALIGRSLPREGWLIVVFLTIVPWMTMLIVGRRGLNAEHDFSYYVLHVIMTGLAILTLVNVSIAPWPMLAADSGYGADRLLVTPYLLAASLFGYLAAYWFLLPFGWWERAEHKFVLALRAVLGPVLAVLALGLVLVMPFLNAPLADARQARFMTRYADEVAASLSERQWLVTDGSCDNHLMIAAAEQGLSLRLISLPSARSALYMKYIGESFETVRMRNLADIGLLPLLHEWISSSEDITDALAIQTVPDLWVGEDFLPIADCSAFLGSRPGSEPDALAVAARSEEFWDRVVPAIAEAESRLKGVQAIQRHLLRHLSFVANNLGVFLEDQGHADRAFATYTRSRQMHADNISALLNQFAMIDHGYETDQADAITGDIKQFMANLQHKQRIWALARYYGYVRMPQAFAEMGLNWAHSGEPGLAVAGIRRAMALMPEEQGGRLRSMLAAAHLAGDEPLKGESIYQELLEEDPDDLAALLGMVRLELRGANPRDALKYLNRARGAGADADRVALEWAAILLLNGSTAKARVVLNELVEKGVNVPRLWRTLVVALAESGDEKGLATCVEQMRQKLPGRSTVLGLAEAHLALLRRDWPLARDQFENILELDPRHVYALSTLLQLDMAQGMQSRAEEHAQKLLTLDPSHPLANHIKGSLQMEDGNLLLAEDSLRRAVASGGSPDAMNDLAWLLVLNESFEEAEAMLRRALELRKEFPGAYDSLGVLLMRTGRLDEAEKAFTQALAYMPESAAIQLHMAELFGQKDDTANAKLYVGRLERQLDRLSKDQLKQLQALKKTL